MEIQIKGSLIVSKDRRIYSSEPRQRSYIASDGPTYYQGYGAPSWFDMNHEWRNNDGTKSMHLD
jgi:hypothetical protein